MHTSRCRIFAAKLAKRSDKLRPPDLMNVRIRAANACSLIGLITWPDHIWRIDIRDAARTKQRCQEMIIRQCRSLGPKRGNTARPSSSHLHVVQQLYSAASALPPFPSASLTINQRFKSTDNKRHVFAVVSTLILLGITAHSWRRAVASVLI